MTRPIQLADLDDKQKLFLYLQEKENEVATLRRQLAEAEAEKKKKPELDLAHIKDQLELGGKFELDLTGLGGISSDGQNPDIPRVTVLPDTESTLYTAVVLVGATVDNLYILDKSGTPYVWRQVATTPTNMMTLDTPQTVLAAAIKTVQATWIFEVDEYITAVKNGTLMFHVNNTDAAGVNAAATVRALASTAITQMTSFGAGYTGSAFGLVLADYASLNSTAGNGLLIGNLQSTPIHFGTANVVRGTFAAAGGAQGWVLTVGQLIQMVGAIAANTTQLEVKKSTTDGGASVFKVDYEGDVTANDVTIRDLIQTNGSVAVDTVGTNIEVNGLTGVSSNTIFRVLYGGSGVASIDGTGRLGINGNAVIGGTLDVQGAAVLDISLKVGGGTVITKIATYSPSLTPAAVAANTTAEQIFGLAGLSTSDIICAVNKPTAQAGLGIVGMRVSSAANIGITFSNNTAASITPTAAETYKIVAIRS